MKKTSLFNITILSLLIISTNVVSGIVVKSPLKTELIFSERMKGENIDPYSWRKLSFKGKKGGVDMGIKNRYFTEDGASKLSPTGRYFVVKSISGSYFFSGDEGKKYVDRFYCSVVDMKSGCYVSDWSGEACGYDWNNNYDVLENSTGSKKFDFISLRPAINNIIDEFSVLKKNTVISYLRCDAPDKDNVNYYQDLARVNKESKILVEKHIVSYLNGVDVNGSVLKKSLLFTFPDESNVTSSYLVAGDKVKIITVSTDDKWLYIGYIDAKGIPLIAWVKSGSIEK